MDDSMAAILHWSKRYPYLLQFKTGAVPENISMNHLVVVPELGVTVLMYLSESMRDYIVRNFSTCRDTTVSQLKSAIIRRKIRRGDRSQTN